MNFDQMRREILRLEKALQENGFTILQALYRGHIERKKSAARKASEDQRKASEDQLNPAILNSLLEEYFEKTTGTMEEKKKRLAEAEMAEKLEDIGKDAKGEWKVSFVASRKAGRSKAICEDIKLILKPDQKEFVPLSKIYKFLYSKWGTGYKDIKSYKGMVRCMLQDHGYVNTTNRRGGNLNTPQASRRQQKTGGKKQICFLSVGGHGGWRYITSTELKHISEIKRI